MYNMVYGRPHILSNFEGILMDSRLGTPCIFLLTTTKLAIVYEAIHIGGRRIF